MPILSIYRNIFAIRVDIGLSAGRKREEAWISTCQARSEQWRGRLQAFFDREVLPRHRAWLEHVASSQETPPFMGELQEKARAAGLWNLGLPELAADEPGTRLSNLEYAPLAEIMGRLFWAPEVFNCQAPDVPNMIALQNCATPEQKARWLRPLLEAKTRSAFGMTEPDVASSDATNIATRMVRDGSDYVITGRKWFITGAAHPQLQFPDRDGRDRCGRPTARAAIPASSCR